MSTIEQTVSQMLNRFQPSAAAGLTVNFQFEVDEGEAFQICIAEQQCQLKSGLHPDPDVTLRTDATTLSALLSGEQEGMEAFLSGALQVEGDIALSLTLTELFPSGANN